MDQQVSRSRSRSRLVSGLVAKHVQATRNASQGNAWAILLSFYLSGDAAISSPSLAARFVRAISGEQFLTESEGSPLELCCFIYAVVLGHHRALAPLQDRIDTQNVVENAMNFFGGDKNCRPPQGTWSSRTALVTIGLECTSALVNSGSNGNILFEYLVNNHSRELRRAKYIDEYDRFVRWALQKKRQDYVDELFHLLPELAAKMEA